MTNEAFENRIKDAAHDMLNALLDILDYWDDPNMSLTELRERAQAAVTKAVGPITVLPVSPEEMEP